MDYDYRAARDWIYGLVRGDDGRVIDLVPTPASIRERALLLALVEYAPNIEPSTVRLARMLGLGTFDAPDEKAVRRLLQSCQAKGLLRVEHRSGRRSLYTLTMNPGHSAPPSCDEPRAQCPPTPGEVPAPPRAPRPPKQTSKADKKADKDLEPLRLEALAPRKPRKTKPAKPAEAPAQTSAHKRVTDLFFELTKAKHGKAPSWGGGEGNAVNRLLDKVGSADEACQRVANAIGSWRENVTIFDIAKDPNKFLVPDPPRAAGGYGRRPVQQTGVDVFAGVKEI